MNKPRITRSLRSALPWAGAIATVALFAGSAIAYPMPECFQEEEVLMERPTANSTICVDSRGTTNRTDDITTLYVYSDNVPIAATTVQWLIDPNLVMIGIVDTLEIDGSQSLTFGINMGGDRGQFFNMSGNEELLSKHESALVLAMEKHDYYIGYRRFN